MTAKWSAIGCVFSLAGLTLGVSARAQAQTVGTKPAEEVRTFFLANVTETQDAEEILNDVRILLPHAHVYYVQSQGALTVQASAEDMLIAEKTVSELDRRRKVYKITYQIAESDGGKPVGTRHIDLFIPAGSRAVVKQGSRVPIVTGANEKDGTISHPEVQYIDIGLNIEASLEGSGDALRLQTKVEQSSVEDGKTGIGTQDPIIQQTQLQGWSMLSQGKATLLGSLDVPGTTRREEIRVLSEPVK
jgi:type II secretory pathway component GspD/PulD (secretin)